MNNYENQIFKIPIESCDYPQASEFVIKSIEDIIEHAIEKEENKIKQSKNSNATLLRNSRFYGIMEKTNKIFMECGEYYVR